MQEIKRVAAHGATRTVRLSDARAGTTVIIKGLPSRREASLRLRELGLSEGSVLRCVSKSHGNIICEILDTRIAFNGNLARRIIVSAEP